MFSISTAERMTNHTIPIKISSLSGQTWFICSSHNLNKDPTRISHDVLRNIQVELKFKPKMAEPYNECFKDVI